MKIAMVASEANPLIKTGGLGDVVYSLGKELVKLGDEVVIVMPYYRQIKAKNIETELVSSFFTHLSWRTQEVLVYKTKIEGMTYYLVDNNQYFNRDKVYGYFDDGERFAFFTTACETLFLQINFKPDVIHVHDWQVGMLPCLVKENGNPFYKNTYFVYTIHNYAFQGLLPQICLNDFYALPEYLFESGKVRFKDQFSTLKTGIVYADKITTVSPNHRNELLTPEGSMGLDGVLRLREWDFSGIVNGIDIDEFDPQKDQKIFNYNIKSFKKGKEENKRILLETFHLPNDTEAPVYGLVSRLTWQKGMDLVFAAIDALARRGAKICILGSGEYELEQRLEYIRSQYPNNVGIYIGYSDEIAHKVYAGSDFFMMPSLFEPCGIGQMIAQRYGTLPIVREVGGLKDTVISYNGNNEDVSTGFGFIYYDEPSMINTCFQAFDVYLDKNLKNKLALNAMKVDNSWSNSAKKYQELYHGFLKK